MEQAGSGTVCSVRKLSAIHVLETSVPALSDNASGSSRVTHLSGDRLWHISRPLHSNRLSGLGINLDIVTGMPLYTASNPSEFSSWKDVQEKFVIFYASRDREGKMW